MDLGAYEVIPLSELFKVSGGSNTVEEAIQKYRKHKIQPERKQLKAKRRSEGRIIKNLQKKMKEKKESNDNQKNTFEITSDNERDKNLLKYKQSN